MTKSKFGLKKASSFAKKLSKQLSKSPLGRASRGKKVRGYF